MLFFIPLALLIFSSVCLALPIEVSFKGTVSTQGCGYQVGSPVMFVVELNSMQALSNETSSWRTITNALGMPGAYMWHEQCGDGNVVGCNGTVDWRLFASLEGSGLLGTFNIDAPINSVIVQADTLSALKVTVEDRSGNTIGLYAHGNAVDSFEVHVDNVSNLRWRLQGNATTLPPDPNLYFPDYYGAYTVTGNGTLVCSEKMTFGLDNMAIRDGAVCSQSEARRANDTMGMCKAILDEGQRCLCARVVAMSHSACCETLSLQLHDVRCSVKCSGYGIALCAAVSDEINKCSSLVNSSAELCSCIRGIALLSDGCCPSITKSLEANLTHLNCPVSCGSNVLDAEYVPSTPAQIPDVGDPLQAPITSGAVSFDALEVDVEIQHTSVADLTVSLTAPDGTEVQLFQRLPGSKEDMRVTFSDFSLMTMDNVDVSQLAQGITLQPEKSLHAIQSPQPNGSWVLQVQDVSLDETGVLKNWKLRLITFGPPSSFNPHSQSPPDQSSSPSMSVSLSPSSSGQPTASPILKPSPSRSLFMSPSSSSTPSPSLSPLPNALQPSHSPPPEYSTSPSPNHITPTSVPSIPLQPNTQSSLNSGANIPISASHPASSFANSTAALVSMSQTAPVSIRDQISPSQSTMPPSGSIGPQSQDDIIFDGSTMVSEPRNYAVGGNGRIRFLSSSTTIFNASVTFGGQGILVAENGSSISFQAPALIQLPARFNHVQADIASGVTVIFRGADVLMENSQGVGDGTISFEVGDGVQDLSRSLRRGPIITVINSTVPALRLFGDNAMDHSRSVSGSTKGIFCGVTQGPLFLDSASSIELQLQCKVQGKPYSNTFQSLTHPIGSRVVTTDLGTSSLPTMFYALPNPSGIVLEVVPSSVGSPIMPIVVYNTSTSCSTFWQSHIESCGPRHYCSVSEVLHPNESVCVVQLTEVELTNTTDSNNTMLGLLALLALVPILGMTATCIFYWLNRRRRTLASSHMRKV